jgi:hypothetical protein
MTIDYRRNAYQLPTTNHQHNFCQHTITPSHHHIIAAVAFARRITEAKALNTPPH